ncbi:MAG: hypothetical protein KGI66_04575, partial [Patescibacteria group bacterium]|nr:hypothetical protein [Patescibacteria group bacterium]
LPTHSGYFAAYLKDSHYGESPKDFSFGIATFVRSDIGHSFYKSVELLDLSRTWSDYSGRSAAGVALAVEVEGFAVINIHGTWQDLVVEDTEAKIEESHKLIGLADEMPGRKILCGDFNLAPETRAIKVLDGAFVNLIDKNRITDTRGPLYTRSLRFADYIFTGQDVHARTLTVPGVSISDHLPLILEVD